MDHFQSWATRPLLCLSSSPLYSLVSRPEENESGCTAVQRDCVLVFIIHICLHVLSSFFHTALLCQPVHLLSLRTFLHVINALLSLKTLCPFYESNSRSLCIDLLDSYEGAPQELPDFISFEALSQVHFIPRQNEG